jgi:uncharacterized protein YjbI with pentapeptide repeats
MFLWRKKSDSKRTEVIKLIAAAAQPLKLKGLDLSGLYLTYISSEKVNFSDANICKTVLNFTKLKGADLRKANLTQAYLTFTDLLDVLLGAADLTSAKYNATIVQRTNS